MTREEFVRKNSWVLGVIRDRCGLTQAEKDYLDHAIEYLGQEPCKYAISMSVIEDVKAEIGEYRDNFILANRHDLAAVAENCLMFIDKHISGKESE